MLFVGLSRVRHCMDLMLEDDFPALSQILKLRSQSGYHMRLRWEQKMRARFGHTVRMHMRDTTKYSAKRCWSPEESNFADRILLWLKKHADSDKQRLLDRITLHDLNSDESSLELLDRVRAKLKMYPHCHEVNENCTRPRKQVIVFFGGHS